MKLNQIARRLTHLAPLCLALTAHGALAAPLDGGEILQRDGRECEIGPEHMGPVQIDRPQVGPGEIHIHQHRPAQQIGRAHV